MVIHSRRSWSNFEKVLLTFYLLKNYILLTRTAQKNHISLLIKSGIFGYFIYTHGEKRIVILACKGAGVIFSSAWPRWVSFFSPRNDNQVDSSDRDSYAIRLLLKYGVVVKRKFIETDLLSKISTFIPYRRDMYEPLKRTSSQIVRVAAASGLAQEFRIVLPAKVKNKNSTS